MVWFGWCEWLVQSKVRIAGAHVQLSVLKVKKKIIYKLTFCLYSKLTTVCVQSLQQYV